MKYLGLLLALVFVLNFAAKNPAEAGEFPKEFGSITGYPTPPVKGGEAELDYCYYYSKRIWELVNDQPRNKGTLEGLSKLVRQSLGALGASEDISEIEKYMNRAYATKEEMAASRFYSCGKRLKLPIEERHKRNFETCFDKLNVPRYIANLRSHGQASSQAKAKLKAANPSSAHSSIEAVVQDIYSKETDEAVEDFLKTTFLKCIVTLGENSNPK